MKNLNTPIITCNFIILLLVFLYLLIDQTNAQVAVNSSITFFSSNLPIIVINTHGQTIKDSPKIIVDMGIIDNGEGNRNNLTDTYNGFNGKIAIEVRGSSSQMYPKKQYGFETRDSVGNDIDVSLLGMPEDNDWILYAPYADKSLIRDVLVYRISNIMGRYASRTRFCEVVIDGQYVGVYVLMEKIKRGKKRVNIAKLSTSDTTGEALTGGYIIKVDKIEGDETYGWISQYPPVTYTGSKIRYQYHYPNQNDILPAQKNYIQAFIKSFETLMSSNNYSDTSTGYSKIISVKSFVDYFLINELSKNVDGFRLSAFMYKDKDSVGGQLKMGPVWDYNFAFGNANYYDAFLSNGWQLVYFSTNTSYQSTDTYPPPFYWKKLFDDPNFLNKAATRWNELRKDVLVNNKINGIIDSLVTLLDESQKRNFTKWPIIGQYLWPNYFNGKSYQDEINYLKTWVQQRFAWMDTELEKYIITKNEEKQMLPLNFILSQNYPNPFNAVTIIKYHIPSSGNVKLSVFNLLGKEIAVVEDGFKHEGNYETSYNADNLASGVYFYKLNFTGIQNSRNISLSDYKKFILLK